MHLRCHLHRPRQLGWKCSCNGPIYHASRGRCRQSGRGSWYRRRGTDWCLLDPRSLAQRRYRSQQCPGLDQSLDFAGRHRHRLRSRWRRQSWQWSRRQGRSPGQLRHPPIFCSTQWRFRKLCTLHRLCRIQLLRIQATFLCMTDSLEPRWDGALTFCPRS